MVLRLRGHRHATRLGVSEGLVHRHTLCMATTSVSKRWRLGVGRSGGCPKAGTAAVHSAVPDRGVCTAWTAADQSTHYSRSAMGTASAAGSTSQQHSNLTTTQPCKYCCMCTACCQHIAQAGPYPGPGLPGPQEAQGGRKQGWELAELPRQRWG